MSKSTIIMMRHGMCDYVSDGKFDDILLDRTGIQSIAYCAALLKEKNIHPNVILTSTAARCIETGRVMKMEMQKPFQGISLIPHVDFLYERKPIDDIFKGIKTIRNLSEKEGKNTLLFISHQAILEHTRDQIAHISPKRDAFCGTMVMFEMDGDKVTWAQQPAYGELKETTSTSIQKMQEKIRKITPLPKENPKDKLLTYMFRHGMILQRN